MSTHGPTLPLTVSNSTQSKGAPLIVSTSRIKEKDVDGSSCGDDANSYSVNQRDDYDDASIGDDEREELPEKMVIAVADGNGNIFQYKSEEEKPHSPTTRVVQRRVQAPHSTLGSGIECLKYLFSMILLIFSVIVVLAAIGTQQTVASNSMNVPHFVSCIIFSFLICWLAMMEGGQGALVGLKSVDQKLYEDSHPRALMNTALVHKGDNMERFIVGRQFLVVLVIFGINFIAASIEDARVLGLNGVMTEIFLSSGLGIVLTTIMIGQLTAQVNSASCMLDFINNYFMLFTTWVSLAIEYSGLLHSVYLVQMFFSMMSGKPVESNEPPRNAFQKVLFWVRVLMSLGLLVFAYVVTLSALFNGKTTMWKGVPDLASVIIFFVLMCIVGIMEGMQIALFAVVNMPDDELKRFPVAHENCQLVFSNQKLQAFLIGRQIIVTCCMFVVARITTVYVNTEAGEETVLGVSNGIQSFFNTGLLGAVITTIVASLSWRVVASSFPIAFLSNPLIYLIVRLCLVVEKSGICSASWILARYHKLIINYQPDEVHLEGAAPDTAEPVSRRDKEVHRLNNVCKFIMSLGLLGFSVVLVGAAIFKENTIATDGMGIPAIVAFAALCILIFWLALIEGGQCALASLQLVDKDRYSRTHRRTWLNTSLASMEGNMERLVVGRQFLVVFIVFAINLMASNVKNTDVLGIPHVVGVIFLEAGVAMMLITITFGQLTAVVNAARCPLDFLNNYFMLFITYISLVIERSGLLHSVYCVEIILCSFTGKDVRFNKTSGSASRKFFFWVRVLVSFAILICAFVITLTALFHGQTTMWNNVSELESIIVFFVVLVLMGTMEGVQSALLAIDDVPEEALKTHVVASSNRELAFRGRNLHAFLMGHQIFVTCCMFVLARVSTPYVDVYTAVDTNDDDDDADPYYAVPNDANDDADRDTVLGVSDIVQRVFNTGIFGIIIVTIVGSLTSRIAASTFPIAFLSNPLIYIFIRICLLLNSTGTCSAAWVLARINKLIVDYQPNAVYLDGVKRHTIPAVTRRDKDVDISLAVLGYIFFMVLAISTVIFIVS